MRIFSLFLFVLLLANCKTPQPSSPEERYNGSKTPDLPLSTISIPFSFKAKDIENAINAKLAGVVYEDNNIKDDDMMVRATKTKPITFSLDNNAFNYKVPLKLWLKRALPIGSIEADGEIVLAFTTRYNISEDWSFKTVTTISNYTWTKTPVLKAGFVELPITPIADQLIKRMQSQLTAPLDQQLAAAIDLKLTMRDAWTTLQQPLRMTDAYNLWVKMTPTAVFMAPLKNVSGTIEGLVSVMSYTDVVFGDTPNFRPNTTIAPFKWKTMQTGQDSFRVNILTDVPYPEAEKLANQFMRGYTHIQGKRSVTVTNMRLYGQDNRMVIGTTLTGSYNGTVYLTGRPVFNAEKNAVTLEDVDFDIQTKNALVKSTKWLFDRMLVRKIQDSMVFPLDANISELKNTINSQLTNNQINPNILLNGAVSDILIQHIGLSPGGIQILLSSTGRLNADLRGF